MRNCTRPAVAKEIAERRERQFPLKKGGGEGGGCQIGSKEKKRPLMGLDIVAPAGVELSLFPRQPPAAPFAKGEFLQSFGAASVLERPASV